VNDLIIFDGYNVHVINKDGTPWDVQSEAWFIPKEVAGACGASDPGKYASNLLSRNPEKFEGFRSTLNMRVEGVGIREQTIINENGLYMFLMASDLLKAIQFQRQVTELLKSVRKGETLLIQSQNEDAKLIIQQQRSEAMLRNAKTRQAKLIMDITKNQALSPIAVELLGVNALEILTDKSINYRPEVEKTYTATEIGQELGVSANKIGKLANTNNLKTAEYGITVLDKSRHSDKQVASFRYNEKGRSKISEIYKEAAHEKLQM